MYVKLLRNPLIKIHLRLCEVFFSIAIDIPSFRVILSLLHRFSSGFHLFRSIARQVRTFFIAFIQKIQNCGTERKEICVTVCKSFVAAISSSNEDDVLTALIGFLQPKAAPTLSYVRNLSWRRVWVNLWPHSSHVHTAPLPAAVRVVTPPHRTAREPPAQPVDLSSR